MPRVERGLSNAFSKSKGFGFVGKEKRVLPKSGSSTLSVCMRTVGSMRRDGHGHCSSRYSRERLKGKLDDSYNNKRIRTLQEASDSRVALIIYSAASSVPALLSRRTSLYVDFQEQG